LYQSENVVVIPNYQIEIIREVNYMDTLRVGSNIDAWCTKCKLVLAHTIEAIADTVIKRVQCNTCRGKHQFKSRAPGSKKITVAKQNLPARPRLKSSDYLRLLQSKDISKAYGYNALKHFSKGDLIDHKKFGLGVVVDEKDNTKIEVLFELGSKILVRSCT
jgi:hypothetical protein